MSQLVWMLAASMAMFAFDAPEYDLRNEEIRLSDHIDGRTKSVKIIINVIAGLVEVERI